MSNLQGTLEITIRSKEDYEVNYGVKYTDLVTTISGIDCIIKIPNHLIAYIAGDLAKKEVEKATVNINRITIKKKAS